MTGNVWLTDDEKVAIQRDVLDRFGPCPGGVKGLREWLDLSAAPQVSPADVYDLTTAEFDLPPSPAVRSLAVCGTYRSGSSLVAETLHTAGGYGIPLEYFQSGAPERRFSRWLTGPLPYRDQVIAARTDPTGVFGVKLFWPDLRTLTGVPNLAPEAAAGVIGRALPSPLFVWLRRRDTVAQALSTLRALNSGRWRSIAGRQSLQPRSADAVASPPHSTERARDEGDSCYDFVRLYRLVGMYLHQDALWANCFATASTPPLTVWYEDVAVDPARTLADLTVQLASDGMHPREFGPYPIRLRKQAPASAELAVRRFLVEFREGRSNGHLD